MALRKLCARVEYSRWGVETESIEPGGPSQPQRRTSGISDRSNSHENKGRRRISGALPGLEPAPQGLRKIRGAFPPSSGRVAEPAFPAKSGTLRSSSHANERSRANGMAPRGIIRLRPTWRWLQPPGFGRGKARDAGQRPRKIDRQKSVLLMACRSPRDLQRYASR